MLKRILPILIPLTLTGCLGSITQRLDQVNESLMATNQQLDGRLAKTNQELAQVNNKLIETNEHLTEVEHKLDGTNKKLTQVEGELQEANKKLAVMDQVFKRLQAPKPEQQR